MKPIKAILPVAKWALRLTLAIVLLKDNLDVFQTFNFQNIQFWAAAILVVFSVLLVVGGFMAKETLTVLSGLFISIVLGYKAVVDFSGALTEGVILLLFAFSVALYFLATGNKN